MSKVEDLAQVLRSLLRDGRFKPGDRFPSEYELANEFPVNNKTANKATALLVSEGLLRRGRRGEGTFVGKTRLFPERTVGFLGELSHPYYYSIFKGFQAAALYERTLTTVVTPQPQDLNRVVEDLNQCSIEGFVAVGFGVIETLRKPVIYLEDNLGETHFPDYVTSHSAHGSAMMAKALLKQGHKDIVIFGSVDSNQERIKVLADVFTENGICNMDQRIFTLGAHDRYYHCGQLLKQALKRFPHLTAIATVSDNIADLIIRNFEDLSIPWKGRITLSGFGNVKGISDRYPIATIDQHPSIIGAEAFHALIRKIDSGTVEQIHIEPELINRQFIFPPR